jgi:hypothetical protein
MFTRAGHLYLSWARWIHSSSSYPISWKSVSCLKFQNSFTCYSVQVFPSNPSTGPWVIFCNILNFSQALNQNPPWLTSPCLLSATAYATHSQISSVYGSRCLRQQPEDVPRLGQVKKLKIILKTLHQRYDMHGNNFRCKILRETRDPILA